MKKINFFLLFSLILIAIGYRDFREFNLLSGGNKLSFDKNYSEADKTFKDVISKYDLASAKSNSVVNLYEGALYRELLDTTNNYHFHRGNSEVYLAEKEQNPESQIEDYKKALEEYRFAMKNSSDINIKKNYEIIVKRIEKIEKQQQNQENKDQDNKDSQNQDNSKSNDQENKQDNHKQQNNQNQDQNSNNSEQNKGNEEDQTEKNSNQKQEQTNNNNQNSPESKKQEESTEIKEALATLERLENNEEQAFKNNERLEFLGSDTDESW